MGNKVIFAGNGDSTTGFADIYDINSGQWSTVTIPNFFDTVSWNDYWSGTTVGSKALFHPIASLWSQYVYIYDSINDTWSRKDLALGRDYMAVVSAGNKAFFAGGIAVSDIVNHVDIYNETTNNWTTATLSSERLGIPTTVVNNQVIFAAGWGGPSNVDIYNLDTDQWSVAHLSKDRPYPVAVTLCNLALFADGGVDTVDIYNSLTGNWSTDTLSQTRDFALGLSVGNKAIFAGDLYNLYPDVVEIFTIPEPNTLILLGVALSSLLVFAGGIGRNNIPLRNCRQDSTVV